MADYNTAEPYKYGFTTDVEMEQFPRGLNEQVITAISEKKIYKTRWVWYHTILAGELFIIIILLIGILAKI